MKKEQCPCGSQQLFSRCCGVYIGGAQLPEKPETLMRSRYSAYTQANIDYIQQTMCGPASDGFNADEAREWAGQVNWLGLRVLNSTLENADKGFVEFIARYRLGQTPHKLHERSEFHRIDGRWFYVGGELK